MPHIVTLELGVRATPVEAQQRIREAVQGSSGMIVDASRLSNKALTYRIEVERAGVDRLLGALAACGAVIHQQQHDYPPRGREPEETFVLLHVALVHDEPDQRVELPKVPG